MNEWPRESRENESKRASNEKVIQMAPGRPRGSLATTTEVTCFDDIVKIVREFEESLGIADYYSNIGTHFVADDSRRLGEEWKETYYVVADFQGRKAQCLGYCNFPKR